MSLSIYDVCVPTLGRALGSLAAVLEKGRAHAESEKIDPAVLLGMRLFPDMFALTRQVQTAADNAKGCVARLAQIEPPKYADDESSFAELQQRLQRALAQSIGVQPSKRGMSRHLKHFQMTPKISFHAAGDRTQLALVGTDRPGLLAAVAQVMLGEDVRVHDARIATFGERVEDFFQLTDRLDAPLDGQRQERLLQALLARIGPARD